MCRFNVLHVQMLSTILAYTQGYYYIYHHQSGCNSAQLLQLLNHLLAVRLGTATKLLRMLAATMHDNLT